MASKPMRPCRNPGCPELTRDGYCPKHKPKQQRGRSAEYHGWYSLPIWKDEMRPNQLMREPWCAECAKQSTRTRATIADHIKPHRGRWALFIDRSNLQSLCKNHHDQKTAREQAEFRRENR